MTSNVTGSRDGAIGRAEKYFDDGGFLADLQRRVGIPTTSQEQGSMPALQQYVSGEMTDQHQRPIAKILRETGAHPQVDVHANRHVPSPSPVNSRAPGQGVRMNAIVAVGHDPPGAAVAAVIEYLDQRCQGIRAGTGVFLLVREGVEADLLAGREVESSLGVVDNVAIAEQSSHAPGECNRDDVEKHWRMRGSGSSPRSFFNVRHL